MPLAPMCCATSSKGSHVFSAFASAPLPCWFDEGAVSSAAEGLSWCSLPLGCVQAALREMLTALTAAPSPGGGPRHKGASSPHAGPGGPGDGGEGAPESTAGGTGAQETPDAADKPKACPLLDAAFMLKLPVAVPLTRIPQHK